MGDKSDKGIDPDLAEFARALGKAAARRDFEKWMIRGGAAGTSKSKRSSRTKDKTDKDREGD